MLRQLAVLYAEINVGTPVSGEFVTIFECRRRENSPENAPQGHVLRESGGMSSRESRGMSSGKF